MNELQNQPTISLQNQIDWIKDLRESIDGGIEINLLALPQEQMMLRKIHENLIGVKLWNKLDPKDQGDAVKELAIALDKAFQLIKFWHHTYTSNKGGSNHEDPNYAFESYLQQPDMKLLCEVIVKYPAPVSKSCNDCTREEATNG